MPGLLQRFLPREVGFFDLFAKQAANIHDGANALLKMLSHYTGVPEQVQIVKAIEHEGDEITLALFTKVNQDFITPFDREDIYELCSRLDDVIDLIDAGASRFVLPPSAPSKRPKKPSSTASRSTATKTIATVSAAPSSPSFSTKKKTPSKSSSGKRSSKS